MSTTTLDRPSTPPVMDPPRDGDGGGGGGGGGGGDDRLPPSGGPPIKRARLGIYALLASITMLFAGFLMVYTVLRFSAPTWPPEGIPPIPDSIWVSTVVIALSSVTGHLAVRAVRADRQQPLKLWLLVTLQLGLVFCVTQYLVWDAMVAAGLSLASSNYATNFYAMTALHVAHVLGGIAYLSTCCWGALRGRFSSNVHDRVSNCMLYWHFVGVLWYVLFFALYLV